MPAAIPIATLAISAASTAYSISKAEKERKAAEKRARELENYDRQELTNPYEDMQVSTLGADRQREELARSMSGVANQAAQGGSRAILGVTPALMQQQITQNAQIAAGLDQQEAQRQQAIAQGNMAVQGAYEQREQEDIAGLGNAINVANFQAQNNMDNAIKTGLSGLNMATTMYNGAQNQNKLSNVQGNQVPTFDAGYRMPRSTFNTYGQTEYEYTPWQSLWRPMN